jgi:ABC-type dipeptide/oligopeptide/nickel transport system permease component
VTDLARFAVRRIALATMFVLAVSMSAFVLVRLAPGDATSEMVFSGAPQDAIAAARHRLGLDQPVGSQLARWVAGLARFDLGESSRYGRPVAGLVAEHMAKTASLASLALIVSVLLGLPLGVVTGTRPRSVLSGAVTAVSLVLVCCPPIIGTLALLFFAASTGWLSIEPGALVLPTIALALPLAAMLERLQSQAIADAYHSPGIAAAAARGVTPRRLVWVHAGRQSLRSVLGVAGIAIATLFSGSVAVETITSWPGLGGLTLEALVHRDVYLVAGCALAGAALLAAANLIVDVLRVAADPSAGHAS